MDSKTKKKTPKQQRKAVLSVLLVVAILITTAFAFLSATDSKTNVFTVGNVDIEFHEIFNGIEYGKGEDPGALGIKINNITPGQSIQKAPYIVNSGNNPAYVYFAVGIPTDTSENIYNGSGSYTAKTELNIKVNAYAIQEQYNGATNADETWTNYFKNSMISGTASDAGIELFTLNNGTSAVTTGTHTIGTDWQEFSAPYSVNDGGNTYTYHFFKYVVNNGLLAVDSTTQNLFEYVVFNENIGEKNSDNDNNETFIQPPELNFATLSSTIVSDIIVLRATYGENDEVSEFTIYSDNYTLEQINTTYVGENEDEAPGTPITMDEFLNFWADMAPVSVKSFSEAGMWQDGDIIIEMEGDYAYEYYQYKDDESLIGWYAWVKDPSKTAYEPVPSSKFNVPVLIVSYKHCINLVNAPSIPNGIVSMQSAFNGCTSLVSAPIIPSSVRDVSYCFYNCSSLSGAVEVNATLGDPSSSCNYFAYGTQITEITGTTQYKAELLATNF